RLATGTSMPGNMALGAINDHNTTKEYASVIGSELKALGINVDFAPVVDVNNNPSNPIIGVRSFSSDTKTVSNMAEAFIEGLQNQGIASSLKHFPGHGDTATDSHTGLPMINKTYDDIKACELIPFKAGIDKGVDMVMTAHIVYPQIETTKYISKKTGEEITLPATMSKTILTDILRGDLGYDGIIITDALNMSAIAEHYDKKDVAKYAINAGVDLILMPASLTYENGEIDAYIDMVEELVRSGEVRESDIDESVYRILRLKQKMGILNENNIKFTNEDLAYALKTVGSKEHHDKEFEIAKDAVTLVKGGELLPLDKNGKVLFLNPIVNGENSIEYAIRILKEKGVTGALSYETVNFKDDNVSELKKRIDSAETVVILADTVKNSYFNNNDKSGWQGRFIDKAIEEAHKQNKKVILISCMLPYDAARYGDADAVLCVYGDRALAGLPIIYDGETVTFGANIPAAIFKLFSSEKFKATLPVDIYKTDGDYNYTKEVAFDMNR
ncbi:MAG: beta-hexosaminidase, partial [Clostridia bacterium]|nr:beta-hexosaminidase [Clostridia bacterium]